MTVCSARSLEIPVSSFAHGVSSAPDEPPSPSRSSMGNPAEPSPSATLPHPWAQTAAVNAAPSPSLVGRDQPPSGQLRPTRGFAAVFTVPTGWLAFRVYLPTTSPRRTVLNQKTTLRRVPGVRKAARQAGAGCSEVGSKRGGLVRSGLFPWELGEERALPREV